MNNCSEQIYRLMYERYKDSIDDFVFDTQLGGIDKSVFFVLDDNLNFRIGEVRFENGFYYSFAYGVEDEVKMFGCFLEAIVYVEDQNDIHFDNIEDYLQKVIKQ